MWVWLLYQISAFLYRNYARKRCLCDWFLQLEFERLGLWGLNMLLLIIKVTFCRCAARLLYGPFIKLPRPCQELAADLLFYYTRFSPLFLKVLAQCCLCKCPTTVNYSSLGRVWKPGESERWGGCIFWECKIIMNSVRNLMDFFNFWCVLWGQLTTPKVGIFVFPLLNPFWEEFPLLCRSRFGRFDFCAHRRVAA